MTNSLSTDTMQIKPKEGDKIAQRILELFFLLSRPDAIRILALARGGLRSKTETPSEIGLTKKQYYTRLRQLVDLNLVEKKEQVIERKARSVPVYTTTLFGNLVYERCILDVEEMISNIGKLKVAEILYRSARFSPEEIVRFMSRYM